MTRIALIVFAVLLPTIALAGDNSSNPLRLYRGTTLLQAKTTQTVANTDVLTVSNAAGTEKASIDIEGDLACHDLAATGAVALTGATVVTGKLTANGGIEADGTKFTVADTSGNTAIGGTLVVTGASSIGTLIAGSTVTALKGILSYTSASTDVPSLADAASTTQPFTLAGVAVGDACFVVGAGTALVTTLTMSCFITANTINLQINNNSGGAIDLADQTFTFLLIDAT